MHWLGLDSGTFWSNLKYAVSFWPDIGGGLLKSVVFAIVIGWVSVYQGYYCQPNAKGIGMATTKTVVYSSLLVLGLDFIMSLSDYIRR